MTKPQSSEATLNFNRHPTVNESALFLYQPYINRRSFKRFCFFIVTFHSSISYKSSTQICTTDNGLQKRRSSCTFLCLVPQKIRQGGLILMVHFLFESWCFQYGPISLSSYEFSPVLEVGCLLKILQQSSSNTISLTSVGLFT